MKKISVIPLCGDGVDLGLCINMEMPVEYKILSYRVLQNMGVLFVETDAEPTEFTTVHFHIIPANFDFFVDDHEFVAHWVLQNDDIELDFFCFRIPEGSEWGYNSADYKNSVSDLKMPSDDELRSMFGLGNNEN